MHMLRKISLNTLLFLLLFVPSSKAAEIVPEKQIIEKAQVLEVLNQKMQNVPGTTVKSNTQSLSVKVLDGEDMGKIVTVDNDYLNLKKGDVFYLLHEIDTLNGTEYWNVFDTYRLPTVYFFIGLFILCVILFGGIQGIRGLLSFAASIFLIIYLLLPGITHGYSALYLSIGVSSLIIILGSYITHGFNKTTTSAVVGMIITIIITGFLAYGAVHIGKFTGMSNEESIYLNMDTNGSIDFVGLLLGGILIGLLGVLYDISIGQAIAIEELHTIAKHIPRKTIFKRALRIGREHIGALVNTLVIAYVGASLPLLLLFYSLHSGVAMTLNREIISQEIIRAMIGSIGLVIAVPITTLISTFMIVGKNAAKNPDLIKNEEKNLEKFEHHH